MSFIGITRTVCNPGDAFYGRSASGMYDIPAGLGRQLGGLTVDMNGAAFTLASAGANTGSISDSSDSSSFCHWLVKSSHPIPEPSTLVLVGAGIAGLAASGRHRHSSYLP